MQINKYKIITWILVNFFALTSIWWADWVDVEANLPSGTYDKILKIELIPTDSRAKTFYSFNPDGWPNDALLYTWAIILKSSTPLVFFSFINTQIESKIKINNYVLNYPNTINLTTDATFSNWKISNLFLKNNDSKDIDISFWELRKNWNIYTIPDNTVLNPGQTMDVSNAFNSTGTITLFSPNSESKDFVNVVEKIEPKTETINIPVKKITPKKSEINEVVQENKSTETAPVKVEEPKKEEVPAPVITEQTSPETQNANVENAINEVSNSAPQEEIKPTENLWDNLKISLNWAKNDGNQIFIMMLIVIVTLAWVWIQIVIRRKKV